MNADGQGHTLQREEHRTAVQEKVLYFLLDQYTPLHGDFPFQIVHLYHVQLDIYSERSQPEEVLGIPWVTFMVDAHSRRLLAVYLAFDLSMSASYMMALRECVRRYARLPQILVVDEESGHNNVRFEAFLSQYGIAEVGRPLTEPDKGSPIEQLFGMTERDFIEDVLDTTQHDKGIRDQETIKTNKQDLSATLPLAVFYKRLCQWCYEVYDTRLRPSLGRTPREAYEVGMFLDSARSSHMIPYDETFCILSLPIGRIARVNRSKGVKVLGDFYWSAAFRSPELWNAKVPLLYDPTDMSHVFVFAKGRWLRCQRLRWIPVIDW